MDGCVSIVTSSYIVALRFLGVYHWNERSGSSPRREAPSPSFFTGGPGVSLHLSSSEFLLGDHRISGCREFVMEDPALLVDGRALSVASSIIASITGAGRTCRSRGRRSPPLSIHPARRLVHEPDDGHELEVRQARPQLLDEVDVEKVLLRCGRRRRSAPAGRSSWLREAP